MAIRLLTLSLISTLFFSAPVAAYSCNQQRFDQSTQIKRVVDGDTIQLADGQYVRLIGINAAEMDFKQLKNSSPYAVEARNYLASLIGKSKQVYLQFDQEFIDPYNRMLAHVFNAQKQNMQAEMLNEGLAKHIVIGKNTQYWQCYQQNEDIARQQKKNGWQLAQWHSGKQKMSIKRLYQVKRLMITKGRSLMCGQTKMKRNG